jgi:hypothetical protein
MRTALLATLLSFSASAATYEMTDLKALDKDQSWRELVDHLTDVLPSKRDAEWKAIAERACSGVLDPAAIKDPPTGERTLEQIDELMKRFGWLKDSKVFMSKRAEVGFKAFGWTFSNSRHSTSDDPWLERLKAFVAADAVTPDIALRGAKTVTARLVAVVAFPMFKAALAKGGKPVCKEADLQKSTLGALSEGSWKTEVNEVLTTCWDEMKPVILAEVLKADATRTLQLKLCPVLVEKNALTPDEKKKGCTFE